MVRSFIKKILNRIGYDILHLPTDPLIRKRLELLQGNKIDLILDIGANSGQFALNLRQLGYKSKIVSFEPLPDAFDQLKKNSSRDINWNVKNIAVGNFSGEVEINVSKNSYSSSIYEILPRHIESTADSAYVGKIIVPIDKVDNFISEYYKDGLNLFIKIDTQGYEKQVLEGCARSLPLIKGFQLELSLTPLYRNETLMLQMIDQLRLYGYKLMLLEEGHRDYITGEILQVEGMFFK